MTTGNGPRDGTQANVFLQVVGEGGVQSQEMMIGGGVGDPFFPESTKEAEVRKKFFSILNFFKCSRELIFKLSHYFIVVNMR